MKKIELQKNYLDLQYQKYLQYLNAILIVGVGSLIAFFSSLILNIDKWLSYSLVLVVVASITYFSYKKINYNLDNISNEIKRLEL